MAEQGYVENVAARLKTLAAGDNIALTIEGEVITISTSAALASELSDLQVAMTRSSRPSFRYRVYQAPGGTTSSTASASSRPPRRS